MSDLAADNGAPSLLTPPAVITVPEQRVAIIRLTVPRSDVRTVMPLAIAEVRAALQAQAIPAAGPLFTHHLKMDSAVFDLEVGFAIDRALVETGRVRPGSLPAATLARATYSGGYEGLSSAWEELRDWVEGNGHNAADDLWEVYVSGPEAGGSTEWRTELNQPLTGEQRHSTLGRPGTKIERTSEQEFVVERTVNGPARIAFGAWTKPDLFQRWWVPKSCGLSLISYEADIRTGGSYRLVMGHPSSEQPTAFFGRYIDVTPCARVVWTNEEGGDSGAVTTVTFEEKDGATQVVVHELYTSKEALDEAVASGSTSGWREQLEQLDDLIANLDAKV